MQAVRQVGVSAGLCYPHEPNLAQKRLWGVKTREASKMLTTSFFRLRSASNLFVTAYAKLHIMSTSMEKEKTLLYYIENLTEQEKAKYLNTTVERLMSTNQNLLRNRAKCRRTVHFCTYIEPIVHFIQRYSKAVDVMVQQTSPVALAWGCLRFFVEVGQLHYHDTNVLIC
jgi:hypothetical protein